MGKPEKPHGSDAELVRAALTALDQFLDEVEKHPPLGTSLRKSLPAATKKQIQAFERSTKRALSAGARALFAHGVTNASIEGDAQYGFGRIEILPLARIADRLKWWGQWEEEARVMGKGNAGERLRVEQRRFGIPLWNDDTDIVVDSRTGAVSRGFGEPAPSDRIAKSVGEFLVHFVGAGCFMYGAADRRHFQAYWKQIESFVPFGIAPKQNIWLQHLDRWHRGNITK